MEDRFEPALFGFYFYRETGFLGPQSGALMERFQRFGEALLGVGQVRQVGGIGVAAIGVGDPTLVGDEGTDLLRVELGLGEPAGVLEESIAAL
jgi:hypothetical protein